MRIRLSMRDILLITTFAAVFLSTQSWISSPYAKLAANSVLGGVWGLYWFFRTGRRK